MSFDLLWKGLELTTGAQREHRYEILKKQVEESGMSVDGVQFYLDFFKYGCPPHGGLGFQIPYETAWASQHKRIHFPIQRSNRLFP